MPWTSIAVGVALVAIVLAALYWARADARNAGAAGERAGALEEGRKREKLAEVHLLEERRRRGRALLARLRRKRGERPTPPPAST